MFFRFDEKKIPLEECGLPEKILRRLQKCNCFTLGDVLSLQKVVICNLKDITPIALRQIEEALNIYYLSFDNPQYNNLQVDYSEFGLSKRASHCLRYGHIRNENYLNFITEKELLSIPEIGNKTFTEIKDWMKKRNLHFREHSCMS